MDLGDAVPTATNTQNNQSLWSGGYPRSKVTSPQRKNLMVTTT